MVSLVSIQCAAAVSNSHFQARSDSVHNRKWLNSAQIPSAHGGQGNFEFIFNA